MRRVGAISILLSLGFLVSSCEAVLGVREFRLRDDAGPDGVAVLDGTTEDADAQDSATSPDGTSGEAGAPCDAGATSADPDNCGACGRSCLGGACEASICQPLILAKAGASAPFLSVSADPLPSGLAFVSSYNATTGAAAVARVAKDGAATSLFGIFQRLGSHRPTRIGFAAGRVVTVLTDAAGGAKDGAVVAFRPDGTDASERTGFDRPTRLSTLPTEVWILNETDPDYLWRASPLLGGLELIAGYDLDAGVATGFPPNLAVAAQPSPTGYVFYSRGGEVDRVAKNAAEIGPIGFGGVSSLAATDDWLILGRKTAVVRVRPAGCPSGTPDCPRTLGTGVDIVDVVEDGGVVFYADRSAGEVWSVRIDGSGARRLAAGVKELIHLATDQTAVYFVTPTVLGKVAK